MKNTLANKIAQVTLLFWMMKIVATTLGETLGDFISMTLGIGYLAALGLTLLFFLFVLWLQLRTKSYKVINFWLVIIATTTLGTEISDFMDRSLHLGYTLGSILLLAALVTTLIIWFRKYGNLEVSYITQRPKEVLFWIAVLFSNSLGTAFGDFLTEIPGIGYIMGAAITAGIIALVVVLHHFSKINVVLLFWIAFIFTRPFGATFGDFLTKPISNGGLNLGTLPSSLIALGIMVLLVLFAIRKNKAEVSA